MAGRPGDGDDVLRDECHWTGDFKSWQLRYFIVRKSQVGGYEIVYFKEASLSNMAGMLVTLDIKECLVKELPDRPYTLAFETRRGRKFGFSFRNKALMLEVGMALHLPIQQGQSTSTSETKTPAPAPAPLTPPRSHQAAQASPPRSQRTGAQPPPPGHRPVASTRRKVPTPSSQQSPKSQPPTQSQAKDRCVSAPRPMPRQKCPSPHTEHRRRSAPRPLPRQMSNSSIEGHVEHSGSMPRQNAIDRDDDRPPIPRPRRCSLSSLHHNLSQTSSGEALGSYSSSLSPPSFSSSTSDYASLSRPGSYEITTMPAYRREEVNINLNEAEGYFAIVGSVGKSFKREMVPMLKATPANTGLFRTKLTLAQVLEKFLVSKWQLQSCYVRDNGIVELCFNRDLVQMPAEPLKRITSQSEMEDVELHNLMREFGISHSLLYVSDSQ